ncbi:hypothetical protein [Paenibacillus glacialis]|uniref:Uncharacterized protein n=1 Tax=Paenibacillus glacialis TaxID=494026 RepID=A0A162K5Z1_9BACL|nr:hypothetical protein [Paenibacillus glacialis]OAB43496.1 hypothetical protein PGLA_08775 [Paenibacillus glacialis]
MKDKQSILRYYRSYGISLRNNTLFVDNGLHNYLNEQGLRYGYFIGFQENCREIYRGKYNADMMFDRGSLGDGNWVVQT